MENKVILKERKVTDQEDLEKSRKKFESKSFWPMIKLGPLGTLIYGMSMYPRVFYDHIIMENPLYSLSTFQETSLRSVKWTMKNASLKTLRKSGTFIESMLKAFRCTECFCPLDSKVKREIGGIDGYWLGEKKHDLKDCEAIILYLHGGGYVALSSLIGVRSMCYILKNLRRKRNKHVRVLAIDYTLAPEGPFPTGLNSVERTYRWLVNSGIPGSNNIFLCGDSAGAGLALALLQQLLKSQSAYENITLPLGAVLVSPWVELSCESTSYYTNAKYDWLEPNVCQFAAESYIFGKEGNPARKLSQIPQPQVNKDRIFDWLEKVENNLDFLEFEEGLNKRFSITELGKRLSNSDWGKRLSNSEFGKRLSNNELGKRLSTELARRLSTLSNSSSIKRRSSIRKKHGSKGVRFEKTNSYLRESFAEEITVQIHKPERESLDADYKEFKLQFEENSRNTENSRSNRKSRNTFNTRNSINISRSNRNTRNTFTSINTRNSMNIQNTFNSMNTRNSINTSKSNRNTRNTFNSMNIRNSINTSRSNRNTRNTFTSINTRNSTNTSSTEKFNSNRDTRYTFNTINTFELNPTLYSKEESPYKDPLISPLHTPHRVLEKFPPLFISYGGKELFKDDIEMFIQKCIESKREFGNDDKINKTLLDGQHPDIMVETDENMVHNYPMFINVFGKRSKKALGRIVHFLANRLPAPTDVPNSRKIPSMLPQAQTGNI